MIALKPYIETDKEMQTAVISRLVDLCAPTFSLAHNIKFIAFCCIICEILTTITRCALSLRGPSGDRSWGKLLRIQTKIKEVNIDSMILEVAHCLVYRLFNLRYLNIIHLKFNLFPIILSLSPMPNREPIHVVFDASVSINRPRGDIILV
jgi:hypothetical protein